MQKAKLTPSAKKHFGMGPPWQKSTWGYCALIPEIGWTCDHHHRDEFEAERCARMEIRRRGASDG